MQRFTFFRNCSELSVVLRFAFSCKVATGEFLTRFGQIEARTLYSVPAAQTRHECRLNNAIMRGGPYAYPVYALKDAKCLFKLL